MKVWHICSRNGISSELESYRSSHPRDLCDQVLDIARYLSVEPAMTHDLLDRAASAYFVEI